jgi:hydrogenase maturation protease
MQPEEILVLGVGNPLMGDDGVGARVIELLGERQLAPHIHLQEVGTPGWGLVSWFEHHDSVVLIDAVQMDMSPGDWKKLDFSQVRLLTEEPAFSLHQADLAAGLALAQELDLLPNNLVLYGIQPADLTPGSPLSPHVEASLPELVNSIVQDLQRN